jgi:hypothetical protein
VPPFWPAKVIARIDFCFRGCGSTRQVKTTTNRWQYNNAASPLGLAIVRKLRFLFMEVWTTGAGSGRRRRPIARSEIALRPTFSTSLFPHNAKSLCRIAARAAVARAAGGTKGSDQTYR